MELKGKNIFFLGDSITEGVGASEYDKSYVPVFAELSGANVKMEVGLCKGKKLWDKRESDAKAEAGREIERYAKSKNRSGRDD